MAEFETLTGLFQGDEAAKSGNWCYTYESCTFHYRPCQPSELHYDLRYTDASAAWVLIASIIVFFMKAGFMLVEVSFARTVREKRNVVILKHQDVFASSFGFFLLGFDVISRYGSPQRIPIEFFGITDPVLWFFKFTFASNAATIIGGALVTTKYKLRIPAAFVSAFVISGILHPLIARIVWSDDCNSLSPYRFCQFSTNDTQTQSCGFDCTATMGMNLRIYVLDFAGGGAVHLLGGMAALVLCLFAKFQEWWDTRKHRHRQQLRAGGAEEQEVMQPEGFWDWMYPVNGGEETVSEAALGVIILWFCWFAFNCGSTESVELGRPLIESNPSDSTYPFYGVPSVIAVNMIMATATGGTTAILIAVWAQLRFRAESMNANEIANGLLSSLVAITAGCAFVDYWGACLTGFIAVILYHVGCWLEYKFGIKDTARVVPVHGVCGLWSLIAVGLFVVGDKAMCNLHAAFEGLCYCELRLPPLNWGERLAAQLAGALIMTGISGVGAFLMYGILFIIPIKPIAWVLERVFFLRPNQPPFLRFKGGWLLTSPEEETSMQAVTHLPRPRYPDSDTESYHGARNTRVQADATHRSNMGTHHTPSNYGTIDSAPMQGDSGTQNGILGTSPPSPPSQPLSGSVSWRKTTPRGTSFDLKEDVVWDNGISSDESDQNL